MSIYIAASDYGQDPAIHRIFVIDTAGFTIKDSVPTEHFIGAMTLSPSGERLFTREMVRQFDPTIIKRRNSRAISQVAWETTLPPGEGPLSVIDSGRALLSGRWLIDSETGAHIGEIDSAFHPHGDPVAMRIAVATVKSGTRLPTDTLRMLDLESNNATGMYRAHLQNGTFVHVSSAQIGKSQDVVYVIGIRFGFRDPWLLIGDFKSGETIHQEPIGAEFGKIAEDPSGHYLVVTECPQAGTGIGDRGIIILTTENYERVARLTPESHDLRSTPGQIQYLGDGHRVVVTPMPSSWYSGHPHVIDYISGQVESRIELPIVEPVAGGITVGPNQDGKAE